MSNKKDFYDVLSIQKNASKDEIKKAYRKLAMKYHPDVNKEAGAEETFKEINEAYEVLYDDERRSTYDRFGHDGLNMQQGHPGGGFSGGFGNLNDILNDLFQDSPFSSGGFGGRYGGQRNPNQSTKGRDMQIEVNLTLQETYLGVDKNMELNLKQRCEECDAKGFKKSTDAATCQKCSGSGEEIRVVRTPFGEMKQKTICSACKGKGKEIKNPCSACKGQGTFMASKELEFSIPAGIEDGNKIVLSAKGEAGTNGGPNGDIYIYINVKPDKFFEREGNDLHIIIDVSILDLLQGRNISFKNFDGKVVDINIPSGSNPSTMLRMKNKGFQDIQRHSKGDMYISFNALTPKKLSRKEKGLIADLYKSVDDKTFDAFNKKLSNHLK